MKKEAQHVLFCVIFLLAIHDTSGADAAYNCDPKASNARGDVDLRLTWVESELVWLNSSAEFLMQIQMDELSKFSTVVGEGFRSSAINAVQFKPKEQGFDFLRYSTEMFPARLRASFSKPLVDPDFAISSTVSQLTKVSDVTLPVKMSTVPFFSVLMLFTDQNICNPNGAAATKHARCAIDESEINKVKEHLSRDKVGLILVTTSDEAKKSFDDAFQATGADNFLYSSIAVPAVNGKHSDLPEIAHEIVVDIADLTAKEVAKLACRRFSQIETRAGKEPQTDDAALVMRPPRDVIETTPSAITPTGPAAIATTTPAAIATTTPTAIATTPTAIATTTPAAIPPVIPAVIPPVIPAVIPSTAPVVFPAIIPAVFPPVIPASVPSTAPAATTSTSPAEVPVVLPPLSVEVLPGVLPEALSGLVRREIPTVIPTTIPTAASITPTMTIKATSSTASTGSMLQAGLSFFIGMIVSFRGIF